VGKITGGTDAVIAPYGTAPDTVTQCACVMFELKKNLVDPDRSSLKGKCKDIDDLAETASTMRMKDTNNMDDASNVNVPSDYTQLVTEAVAGALISNQPVLSILIYLDTDLSVALVLIYNRNEDYFFAERYLNLTLSQMAHFVATFLQTSCRPIIK
jgi:hypothetical protein